MKFITTGHVILLLLLIQTTCGFLLDPGTDAKRFMTTVSESCMDSESMDCPTVNTTLNVCANPVMARQMCQKFCGNCNITDGQWTTWTSWSKCDVTCANGTHVRSRTCTDPPPSKPLGKDCLGSGREVQPCHNTVQCPINGEWGQWSIWYSCSQTCDVGMQRRDRHCDSPYPSLNGDHCFGEPITYQICSERACADGSWSQWGLWNTCSVTCGDGFRTRDRSCDSPAPSMLGKTCSGNSQMVSHCSNGPCQGGGWSTWSSWGSCSVTCGEGFKTRTRLCNSPVPSPSGKDCQGNPQDISACHNHRCSDVKSAFSVWSPHSITSGHLTFSQTNYNYGGDYSISTGVFTCHEPGVYQFFVSLTKKRSNSRVDAVECYLYKNSGNVLLIQVDPTDDDTDKGSASVSNSALLDLNIGDTVSLRSCTAVSTMEFWSSFTGFLLYADP